MQKKPCLAVFVDLTKAFDTVDHAQLLRVLENVGIRGTACELISSYLTDRFQYVKIRDTQSDPRTVRCGIPQGTVLGPLLFNIYINDLFQINLDGDLVGFADDAVIFLTEDSWQVLKETAERNISRLFHHLKSKLLTVSVDKTCFLPFTSLNTNLPTYEYLNVKDQSCSCEETIVKTSDRVKYLGVYLDPHMRWNNHINYVANKIRSLLYRFKHFKTILSIPQLKKLYFALIEPHLSYGITAWGGATNNHIDRLEKAQKWAIKIIYNKPLKYPTEMLYAESEIFDLRQLYCFVILVKQQMRKAVTEPYHSYNIRNIINTVEVPKVEKTITQRSFHYLGPKIYNCLPEGIRAITLLSKFKKEVRKWIKLKSRLEIHSLVDIKNTYYTT